jgi:hypothetical protein
LFERNRAVAAVGAIHELVMQQIELGRGSQLREIVPLCCDIVAAVAPRQ